MAKSAPEFTTIVAAPGFALGVRCDEAQLQEIVFLPPQAPLSSENPLALKAAHQLQAWLQNPNSPFDLPLATKGTPFQQQVWAEISTIPRGETRNYGELATILHSAPRAVGGACGANPFPLVVPCHRVIAKNGGLGGFARERGGLLLDIKRWLLKHEQ